jgi:hypothetical protein
MRAQPHHFYAGLQGGYIPNIAEHYDTKTAALDALAEYIDRLDWDGTLKTQGAIRDGYVEFSWSEVVNHFHEHAYIEPCVMVECELEMEDEYA